MKTVQSGSLTLVYDQHCPLCTWYTGKFVRYGFLRENGRIPYGEATTDRALHFDHAEARNKIALLKNGEAVSYGLDSLITVVGVKYPRLARLAKSRLVHSVLLRLYDFISYNRKVIAPVDCNNQCQCVPDGRPFWRIVYLVFVGIIVNIATGLYFVDLLGEHFIGHPVWTDAILFTLQFGFQLVVLRMTGGSRKWLDYIGNLGTISLIGALLLLIFYPGLMLLREAGLDIGLLAPVCYGIVYFQMFYEHLRRVKLLGLSSWLTISWFIYRILIYPFAFEL